MSFATYINNIANDILDACYAGIAKSRTANDPPPRKNVSWGLPPADGCNQLNVFLDPINSITHDWLKTVDRSDSIIVPLVHFKVSLFRCVPSVDDKGNPATAEQLADSAKGLQVDLWAMMTSLYSKIHAHTLYSGQIAANDVKAVRVDTINPSGGFAGFEVNLTILLNDKGAT